MMDKALKWVDSHAHVYLPDFQSDRTAITERAKQAGVTEIYMPNIDTDTIAPMIELADDFPDTCRPMLGLHPCSVKTDYLDQLKYVERQLENYPVIAIGEMGTDLYWDKTYWKEQQEAFRIQASWSKQLRLPMVIHCRETLDETIRMVESIQDGQLTGVFHCFTGTIDQAKAIRDLGFYLGIGGVLTFKKSTLHQTLAQLGHEGVILETDSPYLAPTPNRGKRNEPAYIPLIAGHLAAAWNTDLKEVSRITTLNAHRLFKTLE